MPAKPHKMADVLSELLARRGFGGVQTARDSETAWQAAAGKMLARHSRVGGLRRGVLEVFVTNSTLLQELTFRKSELLRKLSEHLPQGGIKDLRFRLTPAP